MAAPTFFSKEWADTVRDALVAGPSQQARAGKPQMYWDFFELIKSRYPASWALGCRDLPAELGEARRTCSSNGAAGTVTTCQIIG